MFKHWTGYLGVGLAVVCGIVAVWPGMDWPTRAVAGGAAVIFALAGGFRR